MNGRHRTLSDEQYLAIDEFHLMRTDIKIRLEALIRASGMPDRYNTRALETAQERFAEAFFWACAGIANDGPEYQVDG